ncbi:MAG: AMP-binding protein [Myxococcaceae bacterium]
MAGVTGFVGKVALSMLLHRYGETLAKVHVLVRKGSSLSAEIRFFDKVATSEPFEPLRDKYGDRYMDWLKSKLVVHDGDVTDPWAGMEEAHAKSLKGEIDVLVNCAGLVSFNPSLEVGLNVNTHGVRHLCDLCLYLDVPLVHMSTSFVAGNRSGLIFEDEDVTGYFPKRGELDGRDFSLEQELKDCERIVRTLREQADDKQLAADFRTKAIKRLDEEGRDAKDEKALRLAMGRERKLWLSNQLVDAGMKRAQHWGWPNTYTYTKSLGEQVIASTPGLRYALVRPTVVETSVHYPFPGWNEGFTTSAPLLYAIMKSHRSIPANDKAVLDMIPVDQVAGSLIAVIARQLVVSERRVYQQASGDENPFQASRSVELAGLYRRRYFREKKTGNAVMNEFLSKIEPAAVTKNSFNFRSAPLMSKAAQGLSDLIDDYRPKWGAPKFNALLDQTKEKLAELKEQFDGISMIVELFLPFIWENRFIFRCDNTRSLYADMAEHDKALIPWNPKEVDWRTYFLDIHMPGLEKWVFPGLDEATERRRVIPAYRDLLEMLDASVHAWRHRISFRYWEGEKQSRLTYGEVHRYAARVGSYLLAKGLKPQDRVLLVSENRPEWGVAFFGILRAGCTSVPVDKELSQVEILNIAKRSRASVILVSEKVLEDNEGLEDALKGAGLDTKIVTLAEAMAGDRSKPDGIGAVKKSASPDDVASLIFTSGTTGNPKGVMLTHRNFASLVAKLAGTFEIGVGHGILSVLPLHHTFEFSAGFLTPFSRGAEISYIDELTSDRIGDVLETGNITGMIGVPALWQLFHRKVTQEMAARPKFVEETMKGLMAVNAELRNRAGVNLGKLLFWPVHRKFGGQIKFMVSGGSALPDEVHKAFHALGFDLTEGYGLTEAAPVLTVTSPGNKRQAGTVGKALPGIELKIHEPDNDGIGEVLAKGPNVMAGYFEDRDATDAMLKGGWLYTGDLGRIDADGRLFLVGRQKDVIIDANGKNVYPDELEELYGTHEHLKELSVVGLPDENGERVACLAVPDYKDRPRDVVRKELEEHFKNVSSDQPFWRRIKVLRFWDGELPRTSTRKVKRKLVVEELKRLERVAAAGDKAKASKDSNTDWLFALIAEVAQKNVGDVRGESRFTGDLGFDSLMLTELQVALDNAGVAVNALGDLTRLQTVDELRRAVAATGRRPAGEVKAKEITKEAAEKNESLEIDLPAPLAKLGNLLLGWGQQAIYKGVFDVKTTGEAFIPKNRNFLVVSNHASHLDMGLVKVVMGEQGERLVALAAKDYFFNTPLKRAYFENFTNLIPMERKGSLRESLRMAAESLKQGYNLLIFPEGTRSVTGEIAEFYPTLGYLALTCEVDVLPVYLHGTYDALPKGGILPKNTNLEVRFGPPLLIDDMKGRVTGLARSESYRVITKIAEESVRALQQGKVYVPPKLEPEIVEAQSAKPPPPPRDSSDEDDEPKVKPGKKTPPRLRAKGNE